MAEPSVLPQKRFVSDYYQCLVELGSWRLWVDDSPNAALNPLAKAQAYLSKFNEYQLQLDCIQLYLDLAETYCRLALSDQAIGILLRLKYLFQEYVGKKSDLYTAVLCQLAGVYEEKGFIQESVKYLKSALSIYTHLSRKSGGDVAKDTYLQQ